MKKETKRTITIIVLTVVIIAIIGIGMWCNRFMEIDKCLDSGGRWNYETNECEHAE
jgi:FtsZ-interacting cell division protein ZipA